MADHRFINGVADEGLAAAVISSYCRRRVVEEFLGAEAADKFIMYAAVY